MARAGLVTATSAARPVLEIGGTHVSAALVDASAWTLAGSPVRLALDSSADAETILSTLILAGRTIAAPTGARWGVAIPDPFDYERGIGRFHDVAKFEALDGVDVRAALLAGLPEPESVTFVNDADAFTLGEWRNGAATGVRRCVGITLGTGVGSGWVVDGRVADPGTPPGGRIHRLHFAGAPLEETMSRRAIRRAYRAATGDDDADVREIAARAGAGEAAARTVLDHALHSLGAVLGPPLQAFGAQIVVVGGSMAGSWELFEPWLRAGLGDDDLRMAVASGGASAPLIGAAVAAG